MPKPPKTLSLKDQAFVKEYVATMNGTEAYARTHPRSKSRHAARVEASRVLAKPGVKTAIRQALSLDDLKAEMLQCLEMAKDVRSIKEIRGAIMDYADLAGHKVTRAEIKQTSDQEKDDLRKIVTDLLRPQAVVDQPQN